ncbi:MAG: Sir2 family NAD-dependent protein deacetylase [Kouleothrix sp.]|nr:Sir2 family NAD-dependent protein deacetylase [Kouleothrix sp.]
MDRQGIERAACILREARRIVALTGAGISRPSGIPDFRSDGGLWKLDDPMAVASLWGFQANPRRFYTWFRPLLDTIAAALPNPAHLALAQLERAGRLRAIITQNIDGLHQSAGSREVYELHGNMRSATCVRCDRQVPARPLLERVRRGEIPHCECGGVFKPDVVLFDEMLPRGLYWLAHRELATCDALIVAGTALEVAPVCEMPATVLQRGGRLIIVNQGETHLDHYADVTLHADAAVALPAIIEQLQIADRTLQIG